MVKKHKLNVYADQTTMDIINKMRKRFGYSISTTCVNLIRDGYYSKMEREKEVNEWARSLKR